jgi:hypothetical protein
MARILVLIAALLGAASNAVAQESASPDFGFFRARVEPIFLAKRKGLARCYVCHSQGTPYRLQPLQPGKSAWSEQESRLNYEATLRFVAASNPFESRLITMPLAAEAGGIAFHPGGKHWESRDAPEIQTIAAWMRGAK